MSNRLPAAFIQALWNVTTEEQKEEIIKQHRESESVGKSEDA